MAVGAGEFIAIQGPSGCGKTTLLLIAGGLLRPDAGAVLLEGEEIYSRSSESLARLRAEKLGFVFQQFHLLPFLSVLDNVLAADLPLRRREAAGRAGGLVARLGLSERQAHLPAQLSTGERQRTALARALLNRPRLILADEPTGNLDPASAEEVLKALGEFAADGGGVLLVTHSEKAAAAAKRVLRLQAGRLDGN